MTPYRQIANRVDTIAGLAFLIGALVCAAAILISFAYPFMLLVALGIFAALFALRIPVNRLKRSLALRSLEKNRCPWCDSDQIHPAGSDRVNCPACGERFTSKGDRLMERDAQKSSIL